MARVDRVVRVPRLLGEEAEQVRAAVPSAQRGQAPVRGEGGDDGVVRVEGLVLLSAQVLGHRAAEEEAVDFVAELVGVVLVEGEEDEGVVGEVFVVEQLGEELVGPGAGEGDVGVVGVVGHVGRDEAVLREPVVLEVVVEGGEVLDLAQPRRVVGDGVEEDLGVVFAHVVVRPALWVPVPLVPWVGHVLLVLAPGDVLDVEHVGDGGYVGRDLVEVVVVHAEGVAAGGGAVVGLGGVRDGPVVAQEEALLGQLGEVWVIGGIVKVLWSPLACAIGRQDVDLRYFPTRC